MHLGDYGKPAILIYYAYKRINTACLVHPAALGARLAEAERTIAQALGIAHNPHLFVFQILRMEHGQLAPAVGRKIHHKLLGIKWYLEYALARIAADGDSGIDMPQLQFGKHGIAFQLVNGQSYLRIILGIKTDKLGQDIGRDGGAYAQSQIACYITLVFAHQLVNALSLSNSTLGLTDNFFAGNRWRNPLVATLKNAHVEFFFQLNQHSTQGGLRYA